MRLSFIWGFPFCSLLCAFLKNRVRDVLRNDATIRKLSLAPDSSGFTRLSFLKTIEDTTIQVRKNQNANNCLKTFLRKIKKRLQCDSPLPLVHFLKRINNLLIMACKSANGELFERIYHKKAKEKRKAWKDSNKIVRPTRWNAQNISASYMSK